MLVLGRKTDESLLVGSDIVITILGIEGDRVKVGINAPKHITILRSEVRDRQLRAAALESVVTVVQETVVTVGQEPAPAVSQAPVRSR